MLSPDNPEKHLQLCEKPLQSGKPTYVDKTFSPDLATAQAIFDIAAQHNTPCYSTSALRYASEYQGIDTAAITALRSYGPGTLGNYSVHQLEPLCMLMQAVPERVLCLTGDKCVSMLRCSLPMAATPPSAILSKAAGSKWISARARRHGINDTVRLLQRSSLRCWCSSSVTARCPYPMPTRCASWPCAKPRAPRNAGPVGGGTGK